MCTIQAGGLLQINQNYLRNVKSCGVSLWHMTAVCHCHYVCCVSDGFTADANLTNVPDNTVALAGTRVTLRCTTNRDGSEARISWVRNPGTPSAAVIVDYNCQPAFPQYTVTSSSVGQCDLVINNASRAMATTYLCTDQLSSGYAELTVIGELCLR